MNLEQNYVDLPCDIDVEYALLGWVFCDNALMGRLANLRTSDFHSAQHGDAWQAMNQVFSAGNDISPFTVMPLLEDAKAFSESGGAIRYLALSVPQSLSYPDPLKQADYLIKLSQRRSLAIACKEAQNNDSDCSPVEMAGRLSRAAERIMNAQPLDEFQDNYQVTENILAALKDDRRPHSTGIAKLDEAMDGGLYPGRSYGFAARKKIGKTILAGSISHNLNHAGVKHLFICGEMSPEEIQQRTLARATNSFPTAFRSDYGKTRQFGSKIAEYAASMPRNVLFKNAPGLTFDELRSIVGSAVDRHGIKGVILDYWQLVGGKAKNHSTAEHLDEVAQWIADFGRKRGIWAIMMAQLNQDNNTRGGEGVRLAFDQVYNLIPVPEDDHTSLIRRLEMKETRYTQWSNVEGIRMNEYGPYFEQVTA